MELRSQSRSGSGLIAREGRLTCEEFGVKVALVTSSVTGTEASTTMV